MIQILSNLFKKYFYSPLGLLIGNLLVCTWIILSFDAFLEKGISRFSSRLLIYLAINILWPLVWLCLRAYYPKKKIDKIGLVVSISTENDKQTLRIRKDFVEGIINLLKQNNLYDLFHLIVLQNYKAIRAGNILKEYFEKKNELKKKGLLGELLKYPESKRFAKLQKKIKGHFYIWGSIRERKDLENKYILNLDALVTHRPITEDASEELSREFGKIFPKEISFFEKLELNGFKMASYYIVLAARYITGIAALLSGDAFIAYRLHNGLQDEINKCKPIPPQLEHVLISLKDILFRESIIKGGYSFRNKNDIEKAKEYYDDADRIKNNDYQVLIFNSIYSFKVEKNPAKSLGFIKRAKKVSSKNYTWLYNKAFLHLYVENFEVGLKDLKKLRESVVDQCIDFDKELLGSEPDKKQFLFALGYLYYIKKNNLPLALENFEKFLQEIRSDSKYESLRIRAITYIDEIKKGMELEAKG